MADTTIPGLPAVTTPDVSDLFIVDQGGTSRKLTSQQLLDELGVYRATLASDHAISSVTATEVTCGLVGLAAGNYIFQYNIIAQSATATVSPMFGINFTGTAATRAMKCRIAGTGTTAITGVADDAGATSGQIEESVATSAFSTTTPNMGFTGGVATTAVNILYIIEGIILVTASGDLELWHGSETATSTTVKAGTSLFAIRCG